MWEVIIRKNCFSGRWDYTAFEGKTKVKKYILGKDYLSKQGALRGWKSMAKKLKIKKWEVK